MVTQTAGETTTIQARGVPVEVAEEIRRYAASQGVTVGDVFAGLWRYRRLTLDGTLPDHAAVDAGVAPGRSL